MVVEWRKELDYLLYLLFVGLLGWLANVLDVETVFFGKVITVLTLIYGMLLIKNLVSWEEISERLYDAGVYSLFIVIAAYFASAILGSVGIATVYAKYIELLGYLLVFIFLLAASLIYVVKKVRA